MTALQAVQQFKETKKDQFYTAIKINSMMYTYEGGDV